MKPLDPSPTGLIAPSEPALDSLDHAAAGANQAAAVEIPTDQALIDLPLPQLPEDIPPIEAPEFVLSQKVSEDAPAHGAMPAGLPGLGGAPAPEAQDILGGMPTDVESLLAGANTAISHAATQVQDAANNLVGQAGGLLGGGLGGDPSGAATPAAAAIPQLPTLPQLPADPIGALMNGLQIPALPGVDLLFKPILDLLGSFGTGVFGALDPTAILSQSSKIIETAMQIGKGSLATVEQVWEGQASRQAQVAGQEANQQGQETSQRGFDISELTQRAAAVVQQGNAQLLGIAGSFATQATAMAPVILTPPGQAALIASATEHLGQAVSVVNMTRGDLAGKTAELNGVVSQLLGQSGLPSAQEVAQAAAQNIGEPLLAQAQETATQAASASPSSGLNTSTSTIPSSLNTTGTAGTPGSPSGLLGPLGRPGGPGPGPGGPGPGYSGLPSTPGLPGSAVPAVRPIGMPGAALPTGLGAATTPAGTGSSFMGGAPGAAGARQSDDDEHSRNVQPYQSRTGNDDLTGPLGESTPDVIGATHTDELLSSDYEQDQF
ncbi:hypothetical protein APR11_004650 [Nocardia amikacinitolerans]|uniref:hypothetical protein n=1 Tax=Nocardia amikacinitolerans TaxID=756689 RepID=UPI0020A5CA5A|nr:hypothetical protein [Nocardia amikacinitolerans]MCP2298209.1 hypothetical protein [Nocardia amikacinitolerans]